VANLKTIIVTGASGFLGRHLVDQIQNLNFQVLHLSRDKKKIRLETNKIDVCSVDSHSSYQELYDFFFEINSEVVLVHLATHYAGNHSPDDVNKMVVSNIEFPLKVIEALSRAKPGSSVINLSTLFQHFESHYYSPTSLYAATKEAFLRLLEYYASFKLLKVVDITVGDTYGLNDTRRKIIPLLIESVLLGKPIVLGSGLQNLSLIHVTDAARGIAEVIRNLNTDIADEIRRIQIAPSNNILVKDLVKRIEEISGKKLLCTFDPLLDRKREIYMPVSGLNQLESFAPLIDLDTGIRQLLEQKNI
jgi:CDP-3, 6-dideoxy-D-glycero-L-glycero-4-hexulose-4-reductase